MTRQRSLLILILIGYVVIAAMTSIVTPLFEAYDEVWHYPFIAHLAENNLRLPEQKPAVITPWRQQGSQPPLYYLASAALTSWIDTSNLETLHRLNPLPQTGRVLPDGNPNVVVHRADLEAFPWHGAALAIHLIRLFSVVLGLCAVLVTYQIATELFPDKMVIALGAAALHAFLPMFILMSATVTNDALSNLLANLLLLRVIRMVKAQQRPSWKTYSALGIVTGMGLLSKLSIGLYIPVIVLALVVVSVRQRDWRILVYGGAISGGLTIAIAGWWYYRNWQLYGDPTGLNVFFDIVGKRTPIATLSQIWDERVIALKTYWGVYGSMNVLLSGSGYWVFNSIGGIAGIGAIAYIVKRRKSHAPLIITLLLVWPALAVIGLIQWTMRTPGSQGRLLFVALSAFSVWMALGLTWWLPKRLRAASITLVAGYFAAVAFLAPLLIVRPAFAVPPGIIPGEAVANFHAPSSSGQISLSAPRLLTTAGRPGDFIHIEMAWQIVVQTQTDWTLYAHLITPEGIIAGQRDIYPSRGLLATSDLQAGYAWENPLAVPIPQTAYTPNTAMVVIGWYHLPTGERMTLPNGDTTFPVGQVALIPRETGLGVPNPLYVNFEHKIALVGYAMSTLSPHAGEAMTITLYWQALQEVQEDYVVFVHIIDKNTLTKYAGSDAMPAGWTLPTSAWQPGQLITDTHTLIVDSTAPNDIFEVEVGLYLQDDAQTYPRLWIVPEVGEQAANVLFLSRVHVMPSAEIE